MDGRTVILDNCCAYCGEYLPHANIKDLITEQDWKNKHKNSSCGTCYEYLDNMSDEAFRQIIANATRSLNTSNSTYALALNFNRIIVNSNPVLFYYEKKLEELDVRLKELEELFGGKKC